MKIYPHLARLACLLLLLVSASAQEKKAQPPILKTEPKILNGIFSINKKKTIPIEVSATFQITTCNSDGSFSGILTFALTEKEQQKIKQVLGNQTIEIPSNFVHQQPIAEFAKLTECPVLKFDIHALDIDITGHKLQFKKFRLELKETDHPASKALCKFALQIIDGRSIRNPYRRINELLQGVEPR